MDFIWLAALVGFFAATKLFVDFATNLMKEK